MAVADWNTWAVLYLVLLVVAAVALVALLVRAARRPAADTAAEGSGPAGAGAPAASAPAPAEGDTLAAALAGGAGPEPYLAQWVLDAKGERVGETIGLDGERIVLKRPAGFASVPLAKIRLKGGLLVADDDVDWAEAERLGETWRAAGAKPIEYDDSGMPKA